MKPGDLIALKPNYRPKASLHNPQAFLILDQRGKSKFADFVVLDQSGIMIRIPHSSLFIYYEVCSEAG